MDIGIYRQSIDIDYHCVRDHLKSNSNTRKQSFCDVFSNGYIEYAEWQRSIGSGATEYCLFLPLVKVDIAFFQVLFKCVFVS